MMTKKALSTALAVLMMFTLFPLTAPPARASSEAYDTIWVFGSSTYVRKTDGSLWGFGGGLIGDGTTETRLSPVHIMDNVASFSGRHALKTDGSLWGWGSNTDGSIGDGTMEDRLSPVHIMDDVASVIGGRYAIKTDGSLWGWGRNSDELDNESFLGDGTTEDQLSPVHIMDNVASLVEFNKCKYVIKTDGSLWGWGQTQYRGWPGYEFVYVGVGDGTTATRLSPVHIMDDVASVIGGRYAIKTDGSLWGWGVNYSNVNPGFYIGDGTTEDRLSPVHIMDDVASVVGRYAIKTDGSLWGWGSNTNGALGDGTRENRLSPVHIMDDVISVIEERSAIKTDGSLWSWGGANQQSPVHIMDDVTSVVGGYAIKMDGSLWELGSNAHIMDDVASFTGKYAIKTDGSLWGWGSGPIGDGTMNPHLSPFHIMDNVALVTVGGWYTTYALKTDGSLWVWDSNRLSPVHIMDGVALPGTPPTMPPSPPPVPTQPPGTITVAPTSQSVFINGEAVEFEAYNINGNNFFKLRDLAQALSGTDKRYQVGWDEDTSAITLTTGEAYTPIGGEMSLGDGSEKSASLNSGINISMDGSPVSITAYLIEGNNFMRLRDVMQLLDVEVIWDEEANAVRIDTSRPYVE